MQLVASAAAICALQVVVASGFSSLRAQQSTIRAESASGVNATGSPRRIFVDLGANWANTLRLFEDIGLKRTEKPWDVYAFEASPLIQPYLEKFTAWLNGQGPKPPITVPPSGSSVHLDLFASRYGCPRANVGQPWGEAMRNCMFQVFRVPLSQLHADPALQSNDLIQSRLNLAKTPVVGKNRFTAVPAAAGSYTGTLNLGHVTAEQMIRGGAHSQAAGVTASVAMVDFPQWLTSSFSLDDYIIVKMDIEGAEFGILNKLLDGPNACMINVLALECHAWVGDCAAIKAKLAQHPCIQVLIEDAGYQAYDHYSTPDKYFALDPRTR